MTGYLTACDYDLSRHAFCYSAFQYLAESASGERNHTLFADFLDHPNARLFGYSAFKHSTFRDAREDKFPNGAFGTLFSEWRNPLGA